jgi:hypothetical protein
MTMKKKYIYLLAAVAAVSIVLVTALGAHGSILLLKNGWFAAGSKPAAYDMGMTSAEHHSGAKCAYMKSKDAEIEGFGTYMQMTLPGKYLGKNVRMTGWIKSKDVKDWAGMWMRVDGSNPNETLSFDNMQDRAIKGTTDWKQYTITLDVPQKAKAMAFGVLLSGTGEIYFDDITFEILGPATGKDSKTSSYPPAPENLNMED